MAENLTLCVGDRCVRVRVVRGGRLCESQACTWGTVV